MAGLSRAYKRRGNMVSNTGAPVMCLDAGSILSYPGTGTTWTDLSGNGNTGTLTNGPTYSSTNGGSIVFDGSNDYVQTTAYLFTIQQFTISFWCKVGAFTGYTGGIISNSVYTIFGPSGNYQGYTSSFSSGIQIASTTSCIGTVQSNFSTGIWYHYCSVYDGTQTGNSNRLKIYINGQITTLVYDVTVPSTPYNSGLQTRIGFGYAPSGYPYFNGSIASVNYYSRALSAAEVSTNFNLTRGRYGI